MWRLLLTMLCWMPVAALAQPVGEPLVGARKVLNNGPGNQTDPHVSDAVVAYTNEAEGTSEIRYYDLSTDQDRAIPNGGAYDFVADVSGDTVVFTRVLNSSSIFTYNVQTQAAPVEVAPQAGADRRGAVVGRRTVVWQDFSYGSSQPEIAAFDLETQALTRLTTDSYLDRSPAVSSDGSTIVWTKCTAGTACDIWQAVATPGGLVSQALTGAEGEESQPDTNGQLVVYASGRLENGVIQRDIYWQALGGGPESRLLLPGVDSNPSISGSLIAFERQDPASSSPNYDIMLFDMRTHTLYRLTDTPANESLNDVSVGMDGLVRVVWSVPANGYDVVSFSFVLPDNPECQPHLAPTPAEEVCAKPGDRPLVASVMLDRATGKPQVASTEFDAAGEGVLCVDNGYMGAPATAGWVELNGTSVVDPSRFQKDVGLVAQEVSLSGASSLAARIASAPGSSFRVRLYGPQPACAARFQGDELIPGERVEPQPWTPEAVPQLSGSNGFGCGVGGDSLAWLGALMVAALLWRARRQPVPVRRQSPPRVR